MTEDKLMYRILSALAAVALTAGQVAFASPATAAAPQAVLGQSR
jgi:hypothetical protein